MVALLSGLLSLSTFGQDPKTDDSKCRPHLTVAEFLLPEDANVAKDAFRSFRQALLDDDRKTVIGHVRFPLDVVLSGSLLHLNNPHELLDRYDDVFSSFVLSSVRRQDPERLVAGWDGVSDERGTLRFIWNDGVYAVGDVMPTRLAPKGDVADFLSKRLTCPPLVVEGKLAAYDWASQMPAFENIYVDHLIVDVTRVLRGTLTERRIRVDFWGVSHLPDYNLPKDAYTRPGIWRMYLRAADRPPKNSDVCSQDVQERVSFVDESGQEAETQSAFVPISTENDTTMTYAGLSCFEAKKQYVRRQAE